MRELIKEKALEIGFDAVGFTEPSLDNKISEQFDAFISKGHFGDMEWMVANAHRRRDPKVLWPEARSIIVVASNYGPETDPLDDLNADDRGNISVYARNRDYHNILKKRLKKLGRWLSETFQCDLKVFVDTAPVLEKPLAQNAGIGWQGKHSNLVSKDFGSWFFLGELFTTLEIEPDTREHDHCGSCTKCLNICPTNAFPSPYKLDARRCISYLTIEYKGHIPVEFRKPIGNRIYGCDDCLAICPWNKFSKLASEIAFIPIEKLRLPLLKELISLDDAAFRKFFSGSPIKRIGRDRFIRNTLVALGNSKTREVPTDLLKLLSDPAPIVRSMAVWALGQIGEPDIIKSSFRKLFASEKDEVVRCEWKAITSDLHP